ncbi:ArgP/LysG family DNA-binding transcriptional regulator [Rhodovibrionaceae bacterium A322]
MLGHRELQALTAIVDEGGFKAAAEALNVTTGAISQRIQSIEKLLGRPVLVRSTPPRLTETGEQILLYARKMLLLEKEMMADLAQGDSSVLSTLPIAVNQDSISCWFLKAATGINRETGLLLDIKTTDSLSTQKLLKDGTVIAAVTAHPDPVPGCSSRELGALDYLPLCSQTFHERYFNQGLTAESLTKAPVIVFDHDDDSVAEIFQARAFPYESAPKHFIPNSQVILEAIEQDLGWAPVPRLLYERLPDRQKLIVLDLEVPPVRLYWKSWDLASEQVKRVSQLVFREAQTCLIPPGLMPAGGAAG